MTANVLIGITHGGTGATSNTQALVNLGAQAAGTGTAQNLTKWGTSNTIIDAGFVLPSPSSGTNGQILQTDGTVFSLVDNQVGTVTSVSASYPLSSSGGVAPVISVVGQLSNSNGGTGLDLSTTALGTILYTSGTSGQLLVLAPPATPATVPDIATQSWMLVFNFEDVAGVVTPVGPSWVNTAAA